MIKIKLVTTLVLTIVMLAVMTGIAMAESVVVSPDTKQLVPGQTTPDGDHKTYNIAVTGIQSGTHDHTIKATTTGAYGSGLTADLRFRFHKGTAVSGWLTSGSSWTWNDGGAASATLTVDVLDTGSATDTTYKFEVYDAYPTDHWGDDTAEATVFASAVPEFAVVALPIASMVGLFLYFNRRKQIKK